MNVNRLLRFLAVGGLNTAFSYGVFAALLWAGGHYALATLVSSVLGVVTGFFLHGRLVFGNPDPRRFLRFVAVFSLVYLVNVGIQTLARQGMDGFRAGLLATVFTVPLAFLLNRDLVFRQG